MTGSFSAQSPVSAGLAHTCSPSAPDRCDSTDPQTQDGRPPAHRPAHRPLAAADPWDNQAAFTVTLVRRTLERCVVIDMTHGRALHIVTPEQGRAWNEFIQFCLRSRNARDPIVELWLRPHHLLQLVSYHLLLGRSFRPLARDLLRLGHAEKADGGPGANSG
jgi:hypothetical protein